MIVQLLSDLHLEFYRDNGKAFVESLDPTGVDVLVLAGDISTIRNNRLRKALQWFGAKYPHVVFVLGNHEYYEMTVGGALLDLRHTLEKHVPKNVHWLENSAVEIEGQRFLGATLWFQEMDDPLKEYYENHFNDFHVIRHLNPWVYKQNARTLQFLSENVAPGDFVISHHIPTQKGVAPKWVNHTWNRFFVCDVPDDVLRTPAHWVYGHTHDSMAFSIEDCQFHCNPFGYAGRETNPNFEPRYLIDLK